MHEQLFSRQDVALFCGVLTLAMAVRGTVVEKLQGRFGEVASRSIKPGQYWSALAIYYLTSLGLMGYYVYNVHGF